MELNTYIMDQITKLETRIDQLESVLKANNINIPKSKVDIIEDKEYPFILKVQHKTMRSCHTDVWTDIEYKTLYWEGDDHPNGFETEDEAIAYVKSHPEIFTGIKIYLYNRNTDTVRKIKKGY